MNFNIYNSVILAGIIQGFIFTVVVLTSKKLRSRSTFILTALIFIYSIGNLQYILPDIGVLPIATMYKYVYFPWASIIPVLVYLFIFYFLFPERSLKKEKLLFLPFLFFLILTLAFRISFILGNDNNTVFDTYKTVININEVFSVLFSIVLVVLALRIIYNYEKQQINYSSEHIHSNLSWLKSTMLLIFTFTLVWAYLTYRNLFVENTSPDFYVLWIGIAGTIYWLGHIGIYKYGIITERKKIRKFLHSNTSNIKNTNSNVSSTEYITSKYTNDYITALENLLVDKKIFLDSSLTLETVAEQLQLSPSYLSRIIHNEMDTSFPDYLNSFRIEEAKSYLINPEFSKYTIVSIGLEAGFNSKSAFYGVFKRVTGKTPAAFKKDNRV